MVQISLARAGGGFTIRIHNGNDHTVSGHKVVDDSWCFGPVSSNCDSIDWTDNSVVEINSDYEMTSTVGPVECAE